MSETAQHTPGPWMVVPPGGPQGPFYALINGERGWVVAPQIDGEANARLIAAAPDLLAALEGLVTAIEYATWNGKEGWQSGHREYLPTAHNSLLRIGDVSKAKAAIAKARGEVTS